MYVSYTHKAAERGFLVIPLTWNPAKEKSSIGFTCGVSPPPAKMSIYAINCN